MKKLLLVAYETRYARCGGITAVMNYLPGYLRSAAGVATSVITPFHHRIPETRALPMRLVGKVDVPFFGASVPVDLYRYDDRWNWYFLDAREYTIPGERRLAKRDERFFGGVKHPYDVGADAAEQLAILRRDSLFFGAAVARALRELGAGVDWTLVMQDWQAATAALALAGPNRPPGLRLFLTLHNSYDSGGIEPEHLGAVGINHHDVPAPATKSTILGRAIPLLEKPLFTVSEQFARDFTEDIFQSQVMASHLQDELSPLNVIGVNNGPFTSLAVPEKPELAGARQRNYSPLKDWKSKQKAAAVAALAKFVPDEERPAWGCIGRFGKMATDDPDLPWFVLAGRDDTRQKGYDVSAEAIRNFLEEPRSAPEAQFLFFPIPGDEGRDGLLFLRKLAEDYPESVLVLPFIFQEGYLAALQGAAFGIMPSLYEPFGMANEFYLNGAVGIGRATGGLLQQIVPLRSAPSCSDSAKRLSSRWHAASVPATGLLYREPDNNPDVVEHWKAFNAVKYLSQGQDRVAERRTYRLFTDMAGGLEHAITDAIQIYRKPADPNGVQPYFAMLVEGVGHIQRAFSWEWSAAEYNSYLV